VGEGSPYSPPPPQADEIDLTTTSDGEEYPIIYPTLKTDSSTSAMISSLALVPVSTASTSRLDTGNGMFISATTPHPSHFIPTPTPSSPPRSVFRLPNPSSDGVPEVHQGLTSSLSTPIPPRKNPQTPYVRGKTPPGPPPPRQRVSFTFRPSHPPPPSLESPSSHLSRPLSETRTPIDYSDLDRPSVTPVKRGRVGGLEGEPSPRRTRARRWDFPEGLEEYVRRA